MRNWRTDAACKGANIDVFFNIRGAGYREARQMCHSCPVRAECLTDVMEWERTSGLGRFGFVAGLNPDQRRALQIEWDRRPRQVDVRVG